MANIKFLFKRTGTTEKQHERNKAGRSELRPHMTNFVKAEESGNKEATKTALDVIVRGLDRAASKGLIHKNQAANKKSSLTKRFNALS